MKLKGGVKKSSVYLKGAEEQLNPVLRCWLLCVEPCTCAGVA